MLEKANKALEEKKYKEAINLFSNVLESDPNNSFAYQGLAITHYRLDHLEEAKRNANKAISLNPGLHLPYVKLSYIHYRQTGNIEQCYRFAQKAFLLEPDAPEVLECIGFACLLKNENEEGIQFLEKALPKATLKNGIQNNLAIGYSRLNRFEDAHKMTLQLYKSQPSLKTFIRSVISFMALNRTKRILGITLALSFLGAFAVNSPEILIIPFIFTVATLIAGIYAILQKHKRVGVFALIFSIGLLLVLFISINIIN